MQFSNFNSSALVFALVASLSLHSCQSSLDKFDDYNNENPPALEDDIRKVKAPDGFTFESASDSEIEISAVKPGTTSPVANVTVSLWTESDDQTPVKLAYGVTNANGTWNPTLSIPIDRDSLTIRVESPGFPSMHRIAVSQSRVNSYTLGAENASGRIVPEIMPPAPDTTGFGDGTLNSRAPMSYMGSYDKLGVPTYLTSPGDIWTDVLDFIAANLPEAGNGGVPEENPSYLDPNNTGSVLMQEDGELWISFAHEGAGFTNTLGYFTYDPKNPPSRKNRIDKHTVIFPNISYVGSGGGLTVGDRVYLGKFPAGTAVGWFLVPNGWNQRRGRVIDNSSTRYSIDELNRFTDSKNSKHMVLLANEVREFLVLGIEDLNRPNGDNDFNDAVFFIEPKPWSSVNIKQTPVIALPADDSDNDGVFDNVDLYPNDKDRAFENYSPGQGLHGTIAFEDMWPRIGDYDFNDLVVDFNFIETLNANMEIVDIRADFKIRAIGSSQNHGFALQFPFDPSAVKEVSGYSLKNNTYMTLNSNGTEQGVNSTVIPVFTDGFSLFDERFGIINTDPSKPEHSSSTVSMTITFNRPMQRGDLGMAPYDPFMIRSMDRTREIHLAGMTPTSKADLSLFNTEADYSDLSRGDNYIDENNLPWAICIPSEFKHPAEQTRIDEVYTNYIDFATYGGKSSQSWFRNNSGNVNKAKAY